MVGRERVIKRRNRASEVKDGRRKRKEATVGVRKAAWGKQTESDV